jgi:hypothetical protein
MAEPDQALSESTASRAAPVPVAPGAAGEQTGSRSGSRSSITGNASGAAIPGTASGPGRPGDAEQVWPRILRVAWMAILLGFAIEALLLASAVAFGAYKGPRPFLADLAQKVTWSVIVCVGIAFGTAASKARPQVMGLLGLAAAPLAFQVARTIHKGMAQALSLAGGGLPFVSVALVGALKSLEYGALGWGIGWVGRRRAGLGAHAGAGLAIGLTFGAGLTLLTSQTPSGLAPLPELLAKGINEVLFPIGCSLALYAADALGKRIG